MFNVGPGEVIIVALVLLIAVGPEQLPGVIRRAGRAVSQIRSMTEGLRDDFMAGMDEIERATDPKTWTESEASSPSKVKKDPALAAKNPSTEDDKPDREAESAEKESADAEPSADDTAAPEPAPSEPVDVEPAADSDVEPPADSDSEPAADSDSESDSDSAPDPMLADAAPARVVDPESIGNGSHDGLGTNGTSSGGNGASADGSGATAAAGEDEDEKEEA